MPRNTSYHGQHQEVHIGKFSTNRYGVLSGSVQRHILEEFDSPKWGYLSVAMAPSAPVPCVNVDREYDARKCMGIYTYSYEGVTDQVSFADRIFCSLEGSDNEEPIETHPNFQDLFKKYQGQKDSQGRFIGFKYGVITVDGQKTFNPLYGLDHFLTIGLIWTRTRVVQALPANLLSRVDTIDTPQGFGAMLPPQLKSPRNWLKLAPVAQQRSNFINLSERWMASGRNGWNADVYTPKSSMGSVS